jgi:2-oxo-3-hexenedioate decarboxylase
VSAPAALPPARLAAIADRLQRARERREPIESLRGEGLGWGDAHAVQALLRERRERAGERVCGYKVAVTSEQKLKALGLEAPLCGFLCDSDAVEGGTLAAVGLIAPRIEPEIAFVMKRALAGPRCSVLDVLGATDFVVGAFEILDSRFVKGAFDPISATADNVSTARHVLGSTIRRPHDLDLSLVGVVVTRDGEFVATGTSAGVFGHPAASVAALVRALDGQGRRLEAGALVLTGGLVEAFGVAAGDRLTARYAGLGEVGLRID